MSEKISLLECFGFYETGNYKIVVVTRDSVIYQLSEGTCFRVTKCESVPIAISIIDSNHFCVASMNNEIMWIDFEVRSMKTCFTVDHFLLNVRVLAFQCIASHVPLRAWKVYHCKIVLNFWLLDWNPVRLSWSLIEAGSCRNFTQSPGLSHA